MTIKFDEEINENTFSESSVAVISCANPNETHSKEALLVAYQCFYNGLSPHLYYFSPDTTKEKEDRRTITKNGIAVTHFGSSPECTFNAIQTLGKYKSRTWIGIAPELSEESNIAREGVIWLWSQKPSRDIIYNNMGLDMAIVHWGHDYLHNVKLVVCQAKDEKILYSKKVNVIAEEETLSNTKIFI